ncbi:hypothetical protein DV515_00009701 [Chloebia gouldiae]|uniref:Uncharacterized protein n=1 Tax=Chloebia gouldiae TaxID=44316 RepID=A0A3L8SB50_CHLGU|nr:hypothetical protein DV515_00009701 [Chloebia gouldiae]
MWRWPMWPETDGVPFAGFRALQASWKTILAMQEHNCHCSGLQLSKVIEQLPNIESTASIFAGGISDGIICSAPGIRKGKDLLKVPYELFGACAVRAAHVQPAGSHQHGFEQRSSPKLGEPGDGGRGGCEPKARPRPASLRHAIATVAITGVVCGVVCLMMLAAAGYGCAYAAITAKYHRERLAAVGQHGTPEEKEPFEGSGA